ncbi:MAG: N,N-dimethylformamidase beta subunit family domain-containing protein, partial [bacterium]
PPASQFTNWELPFVVCAEKDGSTLDFATNEGLEFRPEILKNYKLILSVGHDEYWSAPMRDSLEAYIAGGGNVAFFSGNSICWQVRAENEGTALTSWKQNAGSDPHFKSGQFATLSSLWSHHLVQRPENKLTGVGFLFGGYHKSHGHFMGGSGGYTVHRPGHWVFEGTGMLQGDLLGSKDSIVGYECDGCELTIGPDGLPAATGNDGTPKNFVVLATAPAMWHPDDAWWYEKFEHGRLGAAVLGTYTSAGGGTVITAGSTDWAHGLRGGDKSVSLITRNILQKLGQTKPEKP